VKEVENVYDVVDEDTYSKKVNDRLRDDWIVDDGTGYCETGHEVFDDDILDEDDSRGRKKESRKSNKKDKPSKEEKESQKAGFLSVRDMLSNMPVKRKRAEMGESSTASAASVEGDDILGDLLQELNEVKKPKTSLPSGKSLLERTLATEKLISSGRIQEEKKPFMSQKVTIKRKFQVFQVKTEPIDPEDSIAEDHKSFYSSRSSTSAAPVAPTETELIDDFSDDFMDIADQVDENVDNTVGQSILNSVKDEPKEQEFQLLEVEDFENYRQVGVKEEPVVEDDNKVDFMLSGNSDEPNVLEFYCVLAFIIYSGQKVILVVLFQIMNFYWFDMYEEPKNPGFIYVFGKIKVKGPGNVYNSCCVILKNVERCLYCLPREKVPLVYQKMHSLKHLITLIITLPLHYFQKKNSTVDVEFMDVYEEFETKIVPKYKLNAFKTKRVEKKYCFGEENVPSLSEYMEVRYSVSFVQNCIIKSQCSVLLQ
jgi:DNA polymerase alpha subunit A